MKRETENQPLKAAEELNYRGHRIWYSNMQISSGRKAEGKGRAGADGGLGGEMREMNEVKKRTQWVYTKGEVGGNSKKGEGKVNSAGRKGNPSPKGEAQRTVCEKRDDGP